MTITMRVYVGTYAKYNDGSLFGAWLDIEDYADKDDFHEACKKLHEDEEDPELMFQDWEGIPEGMISESHIDPELFDLAAEDDDTIELMVVYRENVDQSGSLEAAREAFRGKYDSDEDYAEEFHSECGDLDAVPERLRYHIDWASVAREMSHDGITFVRHDGSTWVFVD